jgi:hypothetical protein
MAAGGSDGSLTAWYGRGGRDIWTVRNAHAGRVAAVAFYGGRLFSAGPEGILVWNQTTGLRVNMTLQGSLAATAVTSLAVYDGRLLGGGDHLTAWNVSDGKPLWQRPRQHVLSMTVVGPLLLCGSATNITTVNACTLQTHSTGPAASKEIN